MNTITLLKNELDGNPGLYSGMTDQQVADELLAVDKTRNRTSMTGAELWENTDAAQFNDATMTDAKRAQWLAMCAIDSVNPFGPAQPIVIGIFAGVAGDTVANLATARVEAVTQAELLGIGDIENASLVGWVTEARAV